MVHMLKFNTMIEVTVIQSFKTPAKDASKMLLFFKQMLSFCNYLP